MPDSLASKLTALETILREHAPLLVAYSGGVDSTYLLALAAKVLGEHVLGVIADSPSLPRQQLTDALEVARQIGARVEVIASEEMDNPEYARNPLNRCYFCKAELFAKMHKLARERRFAVLAYGENADDPPGDRPGHRAADEAAVLAPLRQAGLTKADIRQLSREMGLSTAEAPSQPCLSSRIPFGTPVTARALAMIEAGEAHLRSLGFRVLRVRHLVPPEAPSAPRARVQVALEELPELYRRQPEVEAGILAAGYSAVEIDPKGYRTGAAGIP